MNSENTADKQFVITEKMSMNSHKIKSGDLVMINREFFIDTAEAYEKLRDRYNDILAHLARVIKHKQFGRGCESESDRDRLNHSRTAENFDLYQYPAQYNAKAVNYMAIDEDNLVPAIFCSIESQEPEYARGRRIAYLINVVYDGKMLTRIIGTKLYYRSDTHFGHGIVKVCR